MAINILSAVAVKNATCEGASIRKLSDGGGLYLWVYADGRKYWRLRYYLLGKEKTLSLGVYPAVSLEKARKLAAEQRDKLQDNKDPSAERKADRLQAKIAANNSFEFVAREWLSKRLSIWVKKHADDVIRRLEVNIFPQIGLRPISEIQPPELLAAIQKIESRGAYDLAHRVMGVCGQVFRYGVSTGRCNRDLTVDLRGALTPHVAKNQNAIKPADLPKLIKAIHSYDQLGDLKTRLALEMLAYTFVRTQELINAPWDEFDLDKALWVIPASRMKMKNDHLVPLSRQTLELLKELKTLSGRSRFILPGRNPEKTVSNNTMLYALYRLGYKDVMTGHGFRAVASTILNEIGFDPDVVERQLAHVERNEVRAAYNRAEYLKDRTSMMQWWADYLDSARLLPQD